MSQGAPLGAETPFHIKDLPDCASLVLSSRSVVGPDRIIRIILSPFVVRAQKAQAPVFHHLRGMFSAAPDGRRAKNTLKSRAV